MHGSSIPRTSPQRDLPFNSTQPNPFSSSSAPASAVPSQQTYNMQQPISNDPISAFPPRNLFSNPSQPRGSDEQQQPDPFDDDIDLSGELGVFEQLDAIKFVLQHFDVQQADPVLFERLKRRAFTVPHAWVVLSLWLKLSECLIWSEHCSLMLVLP